MEAMRKRIRELEMENEILKKKVDFGESKISVDDITKSIVKLGYEVKKVQVK